MGILVPMANTYVSDAQYTTTKATMTELRNAILAYQRDMKGVAVWTATPSGMVGPVPGTTGVPLTLKDLLVQPNDPFGNPVATFNPVTRLGWRGPYLQQATGAFSANLDSSFYPNGFTPLLGLYNYGSLGDPAFVDGWGNPIVLQWPQTQLASDTVDVLAQYVRLVSAGPPTKNVNDTLYSVIDTLTYNPLAGSTNSAAVRLTPSFPTPSQPGLVNQRGNDLVLFVLTQDLYP